MKEKAEEKATGNAEEKAKGNEKLSLLQKGLLAFLYGLLILMVVFSLLALKNLGEEGYNRCIQEKCEKKGEAYCTKYREISNCCLGAGGEIAAAEGGYACAFGK